MSKKTKKLSNTKKNRLSLLAMPKPKVLELLYMATQPVTTEQLKEVLADTDAAEVHVWTELDIMEITMKSTVTVDVETMNGFMEDEEDLAFMKEHNIQSVYAITVEEPALEEFKGYAKKFVESFGGFLCSDSDDFMPVYEL